MRFLYLYQHDHVAAYLEKGVFRSAMSAKLTHFAANVPIYFKWVIEQWESFI